MLRPDRKKNIQKTVIFFTDYLTLFFICIILFAYHMKMRIEKMIFTADRAFSGQKRCEIASTTTPPPTFCTKIHLFCTLFPADGPSGSCDGNNILNRGCAPSQKERGARAAFRFLMGRLRAVLGSALLSAGLDE
jgi:hypothetical protein